MGLTREFMRDLNNEIEIILIHQRAEAIARLWKHFKLSIDQIESVLDFFGGNVSMAFEYLNSQERWPTIVPLPTIIDEAHVKFDISEAKPMILGTTALPFAPCNNNLPDPLPVNDQCMGELKFRCNDCRNRVDWVDPHYGLCQRCLPF